MAVQEVTPEIYELGKSFYSEGMAELEKVVYGEEQARLAALTGLV